MRDPTAALRTMKHQLTLRPMLLYIALFAVGLGLLRFGFTARIEPPAPQVWSSFVGSLCVVMAVCCPIGFLISGRDGEANAFAVAILIGIFGWCVTAVFVIG